MNCRKTGASLEPKGGQAAGSSTPAQAPLPQHRDARSPGSSASPATPAAEPRGAPCTTGDRHGSAAASVDWTLSKEGGGRKRKVQWEAEVAPRAGSKAAFGCSGTPGTRAETPHAKDRPLGRGEKRNFTVLQMSRKSTTPLEKSKSTRSLAAHTDSTCTRPSTPATRLGNYSSCHTKIKACPLPTNAGIQHQKNISLCSQLLIFRQTRFVRQTDLCSPHPNSRSSVTHGSRLLFTHAGRTNPPPNPRFPALPC